MRVKCPCCGNYPWESRDSAFFEICSICFWQNDGMEKAGGANHVSLVQGRENYKKFGACMEEFSEYTRKPYGYELPEKNVATQKYPENRAKELFFQYDGKHYYMSLDGVLDEYKKSRVSKRTERAWRQELLDNTIENINSTRNNNLIEGYMNVYVQIGHKFLSKKVISNLIRCIEANFEKMDSFAAILGIERIVSLLKSLKYRTKIIYIVYFNETIEHMVMLMKKNLERGIIIADERYYEDGKLPDYIMPDEQIKRMNRDIEEWQEIIRRRRILLCIQPLHGSSGTYRRR